MKKFFAFLMIGMLLLASVSSALAATIDLSPIEAESNIYTIDVNEDGKAAFIESALSAKERSFVHKYESTYLYSTTKFDVLIANYNQSNNYPIFRLWITYCADNGYQNIDSATFVLGNKQYTFTEIDDPEWLQYDKEKGYIEEVLIRFNTENLDFLLALEEAIKGKSDSVEALDSVKIKLVLHGKEDIVVELGSGFWLDFMALKSAWLDVDGVSYLEDIIGTDMSVTTIY